MNVDSEPAAELISFGEQAFEIDIGESVPDCPIATEQDQGVALDLQQSSRKQEASVESGRSSKYGSETPARSPRVSKKIGKNFSKKASSSKTAGPKSIKAAAKSSKLQPRKKHTKSAIPEVQVRDDEVKSETENQSCRDSFEEESPTSNVRSKKRSKSSITGKGTVRCNTESSTSSNDPDKSRARLNSREPEENTCATASKKTSISPKPHPNVSPVSDPVSTVRVKGSKPVKRKNSLQQDSVSVAKKKHKCNPAGSMTLPKTEKKKREEKHVTRTKPKPKPKKRLESKPSPAVKSRMRATSSAKLGSRSTSGPQTDMRASSDSDDEDEVTHQAGYDTDESEQENEDLEDSMDISESLVDTKSPRSFLGSISCSSSDMYSRDLLEAACTNLPGYSVGTADDACLFVLSEEKKRTPALLLAISRGIPVVSTSYVLMSIEAERWLPWQSYECHSGAKQSRLTKSNSISAGFLKRMRVKHSGSPITPDIFDSIVKNCGGIVVQTRQDVTIVGKDSLVNMNSHESVVSVAWLADSIECQTILPFDKYLCAAT